MIEKTWGRKKRGRRERRKISLLHARGEVGNYWGRKKGTEEGKRKGREEERKEGEKRDRNETGVREKKVEKKRSKKRKEKSEWSKWRDKTRGSVR